MPKEIFDLEQAQAEFQSLFLKDRTLLKARFSFDEAHEVLSTYYACRVLDKNQYLNLTALTNVPKFYHLHFMDALQLERAIKHFFEEKGEDFSKKSFADVGTGAGLPGLYLHSLFPKKEVYLIDALKKRLTFLEELYHEVKDLRASQGFDVEDFAKPHFVHGRAEDLGHQKAFREQIDVVCARAVASLPTLLEYCMPFVKVGGYFFAMKGNKDELSLAEQALKKLNSTHVGTIDYQLDFDQEVRKIYIFRKEKALDKKYPRKAPLPSNKPL